MIALIAKMPVAEGKEAELEAGMKGLIAAVAAEEPGNRLYTLVKSDAGEYLMMELYDDAAALAAHGKGEGFKAAAAKLAGVMAGRPEVTKYEVIA
jgi:quinol monooxygenase YgiN